ncbi:MAG: DUF3999 family protein, partial [Candidatus Electrothrix sp. LOE2]|nr:DUF3999 family protein [Candidatus Electrothrix sp. LOE2]
MKLLRKVMADSADAAGATHELLLLLILSLIFFICSTSVQAGGDNDKRPLQRDDFAYGMNLTISGSHPIYGLNIPAAVYQGCTGADLGDLRVFNADHTVPHLLRSQVSKETKRPAQVLPFFPLFSKTQSSNGSPPDLHTTNQT